MKRVGIGLVCLVIEVGGLKAQFLGGIFSQGSTELKHATTQLALLEAMDGTTQEGYSIFLDGLTNTATIHGTEYGLHQLYFASLDSVNPAVADMPEVGEIINLTNVIFGGFAAALVRWRTGGRLTAAELDDVDRVGGNIAQWVSDILDELTGVLTSGASSMMDADRIRRVGMLDGALQQEYEFVADYIAGVDRLVAERQKALQ